MIYYHSTKEPINTAALFEGRARFVNEIENCLICDGELDIASDAEWYFVCPNGHRYYAEGDEGGLWPTDEGFEGRYPEHAEIISERGKA